QPIVHVIVALGGGSSSEKIASNVLGGVVFEFYRNSGCWFATYLAVRPSHEGKGLARGLLGRVIETIRDRAAPLQQAPPLLAEVEDPRKLSDSLERDKAYRRLLTLESLGFKYLPL